MTESHENGNGNGNGNPTAAEKVGQSAILLAVARVSMALSLPLLGLIYTLGGNYLESRFTAVEEKIATNQEAMSEKVNDLRNSAAARNTNTDRVMDRLTEVVDKLSDKMIQIETKQTQETDNFNRFQTAVLLRLDRFQDSQVAMSNAIAAMTAILQSQKDAARRDSTTSTPQRSVQ